MMPSYIHWSLQLQLEGGLFALTMLPVTFFATQVVIKNFSFIINRFPNGLVKTTLFPPQPVFFFVYCLMGLGKKETLNLDNILSLIY